MAKYKHKNPALTSHSEFSITAAPPADAAPGYLTTPQCAPVTASAGECVHTGEWTQGMRFANCEPQPVKAEVAPAPVQAPAVVEEVVVVREAIVVAMPFALSLDALFDFDSATLRADADAALDALAQRIGQADYQKVDIVGHADRIGAPLYNQRLSERRAQAVRTYLAAHGVDGSN